MVLDTTGHCRATFGIYLLSRCAFGWWRAPSFQPCVDTWTCCTSGKERKASYIWKICDNSAGLLPVILAASGILWGNISSRSSMEEYVQSGANTSTSTTVHHQLYSQLKRDRESLRSAACREQNSKWQLLDNPIILATVWGRWSFDVKKNKFLSIHVSTGQDLLEIVQNQESNRPS